MTGRYERKLRDLCERLGDPPTFTRYRKIGPVLLDVYIRGFLPDNPFKLSWHNPPKLPELVRQQLACWYFEPKNQRRAHFAEARRYVLDLLEAAIQRHLASCGNNLRDYITQETLRFFCVDSPERFRALLMIGAFSKKSAREYWQGITDAIMELDPSRRAKGGRGYYIN